MIRMQVSERVAGEADINLGSRNTVTIDIVSLWRADCIGLADQVAAQIIWMIVGRSISSLDELYVQLARLRPEIYSLIFFEKTGENSHPHRRNYPIFTTLQRLRKEGDWDALTAILGLKVESEYFDNDLYSDFLAKSAVDVFRRFISNTITSKIAQDLYQFLKENIFYLSNDNEWNDYLDHFDPDTSILYHEFIILFIEDIRLLKKHSFTPISCLRIAERYISIPIFNEIWRLRLQGKHSDMLKIKEIKNLAKALRRWEENHNNKNTFMI